MKMKQAVIEIEICLFHLTITNTACGERGKGTGWFTIVDWHVIRKVVELGISLKNAHIPGWMS